jgi:hypothetical protein
MDITRPMPVSELASHDMKHGRSAQNDKLATGVLSKPTVATVLPSRRLSPRKAASIATAIVATAATNEHPADPLLVNFLVTRHLSAKPK